MVNMCFDAFLLLSGIVLSCADDEANNMTDLSLLTMMPFADAQKGLLATPGCNVSINIVIDYANQHENILPGYRLVQHIENEGPNAVLSNSGFIKFYRSGEDNSEKFLSPVIVGPTIGCNLAALSFRMLHFTAISPQCAGIYIIAQRKLYSTLYSVEAGEFNPVAVFAVIKLVGRWKQFAIVTDANNPNEYLMVPPIQKAANKASMRILFYANEFDITAETMKNLKASNARVVVFALVLPPLCIKVLCLAYAAGMRPPLHVFIFTSFGCIFDPSNPAIQVPPGCSREILAFQLKASIFAGNFATRLAFALENGTKTSFGYDDNYFENRFMQQLNGHKPVDYDYRHICHDAAMSAIMTLNTSETILKNFYNKSLMDFREYPKLVGSVVNKTAASIDVTGIRTGKFIYSPEGLFIEDLWIGQFLDGGVTRMWYRLTRLTNATDINDVDSYQIIEVSKPQWMTKSGKPPQDLSEIIHLVTECGIQSISAAIALSALITIGQLVLLARSFRSSVVVTYFDWQQKVLLFIGCLCLNAAAVVLLVGSDHFTVAECRIRPLLTTTGVSIVNSIMAMQTLCFAKLLRLPKKSQACQLPPPIRSGPSRQRATPERSSRKTPRAKSPSSAIEMNLIPSTSASRQLRPSTSQSTRPDAVLPLLSRINFINFTIRIGEFSIAATSLAIVTTWLLSENHEMSSSTSQIEFDEVMDSYFDTSSNLCSSPRQSYWLAGLLAFHTCLLLVSSFLAYSSTRLVIPSGAPKSHCKFLRYAVGNAVILFIAILFSTLILSSSGLNCGPISVVAYGELIYSATTFGILFIGKQ